jgi:integrase
VIEAPGGGVVKQPKTRASVRTVAVDAGTIAAMRRMQVENEQVAKKCATVLDPDGFVFSVEPDGLTPPHPDTFTSNFRRLCDRVGVASDVHLHSLRHFQSTELDAVVTETQKQARMGWSTVHMARHYTGAISSEDRRAADYIGVLLEETGDDVV